MAEINAVIMKKLSEYDLKVQKLCQKTLELSETMPIAAVVDSLKQVVKTLTMNKQSKD